MRIKIISLKNQAVLTDQCHVADSFRDRLRGLIGKSAFAQGQGMLFPQCNNIHMWFMRIPIDVVFLRPTGGRDMEQQSWLVSSVRRKVRPWRPFPVWDFWASDTLELPVGTIERCGIEPGDELCIS